MIFVVSLYLLVAVVAGDEKCGVSPAPGANPVLAEHVPWVATLHLIEPRIMQCTANLIGPKLAVTVGYCAVLQIRVRMYMTLPSCEYDVPPCKFGVKTAIAHPNFTGPFSENDVALVILDNKVPDSSFFCLPKNYFHPNSLVTKETFVVARNFHERGSPIDRTVGILTKRLTVRTMYVMEMEECRRMYRSMYDSQVCVSGYGIEPCYGSAAVPLIDRGADNRWTLRAIYNYGSGECGNSLFPCFYTNLGAHLQWIKDVQHSYELE